MATHFSILTWKIPWTEEPGRLQSMESQRLDTTERTQTHTQDRTIERDLLSSPSRRFYV